MSRMKKVVVTAFGDESVLAIQQADLPDPSSGEVQLSVEYTIVCGADVNMRRGTYPFGRKAPLTPGYSVIGTVRANGQGSAKFRVGDRVACLTIYEGQAELVNLPEKFLIPVPDGLDLKAAVVLILDWTTAYQMLEHAAKVQPGQRIFVHALSGAVLRLARLKGVEVYGTASAKKHAELRELGAIPFDYSNTDWIAAMQQLGGVDAAFDPMGYESFDQSYSILRKGGIGVCYALNLPAWTHQPQRPMVPEVMRIILKGFFFWTGKRTTFYYIDRKSKSFAPDLEHLFALLKEGKIDPPIKGIFTLDQIQDAHREYASSSRAGSVVITVNP